MQDESDSEDDEDQSSGGGGAVLSPQDEVLEKRVFVPRKSWELGIQMFAEGICVST